MQINSRLVLGLSLSAFVLISCSQKNVLDNFSRAPDYKTANTSKKIEVPPDLADGNLDDKLTVSDFTPSAISSYNDYYAQKVQRDGRGYIEVLPELYMTKVVERAGALPYITTDADVTTVWQIVKRYWSENGVSLTTDNAQIGIMETDWLQNRNAKPNDGIAGMLNSLLGFLSDDDRRDRYRMRFARNAQGGTDVAIIYTKSELEKIKEHNLPTTANQLTGFHWTLSDTENPELQLEMTRRIALFISGELERSGELKPSNTSADNISSNIQQRAANTNVGYTKLTQLANGIPALEVYGNYEQAWRIVGIALDKASFSIEDAQFNTGTYRVRYRPESDNKKRGFFSKLFKNNEERPSYLVRIADKGSQSLVVVQDVNGSPAKNREARALLEEINSNR